MKHEQQQLSGEAAGGSGAGRGVASLPVAARYGIAMILVLATVLLRWALIPVIGSGTVYITLFPAMVALAVTFGAGPGLAGNALGILVVEYFLVDPVGQLALTLSLAVRSGIMLVTTWYVGRVGDKLRSARMRAEQEAAAARAARERELVQARELRESEERFALAFANNPAAIALTVLEEGTVLDVNETWLRMTGFARDEVIGKSARFMWPSTEEARRFLDELGEKGALHGWEQAFTDKSGKSFVTQISAQVLTVNGRSVILSTLVDITDRTRAEDQLKASLHEKDVLVREVHHRVKNNLQVISSLVSLQVEESADTALREGLLDIATRVRSMSLVHEKLYRTADLSHIDFAEYTRSLLSYLWEAHGETGSIGLRLELEPVSLPVDTAVPCGLILNELAGNALKHAFKGYQGGGREVVVSLAPAGEGRVSFAVRDNGVGLPAGQDWREAKSLGLRLVQMLARQVRAEVAVRGEPGTAFTLTF